MDVSSGKILWDTLPLQRPAYREEVWYYSGVLVLDESDRARPRIQNEYTKFISNTTKQRRVCQWQTVVLLLLVTDSITIPIGFKFYMPDPVISGGKKKKKSSKRRIF
jgi:hypothetical protein